MDDNNKSELILNLDKLHTTDLGRVRIKRNLCLDVDTDIVNWCRNKIKEPNSNIIRKGKNWYIEADCKITVNSYSYTVITAHKLKNK